MVRGRHTINISHNPKEWRSDRIFKLQTITLISHLSKVLLLIILEWLKVVLAFHFTEQQGLRKDRNMVQQILTLRLMVEKSLERGM